MPEDMMTQDTMAQSTPGSGSPRGPGGVAGPAGGEDTPVTDRLTRWIVRGSVVGVVVSLLVHALIGIVAVLVHLSGAPAGSKGDAGAYQMSVMPESSLTELASQQMSEQTPAPSDAQLPQLPTTDALEAPSSEQLPGVDQDIGKIADGMGGAGDGLSDDGLGLGGAGGGTASFFGVEAKGARFVYVVDVSGSMRGPKLTALKAELVESINGLLDHMSFYVVFFSSDAYPIGGRRRWIDARDAGKRWAVNQIQGVDAQGGTMPWPALSLAFAMRPSPDAIYFMTDGQFDPMVREQIARVNVGSRKIPIHCITFGDRSSAPIMRQIAKDSGGTYSHVDGPS